MAVRVNPEQTPSSMMPISRFLKSKQARLLVIGGSGRVGRLLRRAWALPDLAQEAPLTLWQSRAEPGAGYDLVFDPLSQPKDFARAAAACDVVLMLAGRVRGSEQDLALNTDLALAALQAAQTASHISGQSPAVFIASSAAVYGATTGLLHEDLPPAPAAPYGHAKAMMEAQVKAFLAAQGPGRTADETDLGEPHPAASLPTDQLPGLAPGLASGRATGLASTRPRCLLLRIGNVAGADALLSQAPDQTITLDRRPPPPPEASQPAPPQALRLPEPSAGSDGPERSYIGPVALARALARLTRLAAAHATLPEVLNLAQAGAPSMGALARARGMTVIWRDAPALLAQVQLDTRRAIRLGLVAETPATAQTIVDDLARLKPAPTPAP